MRKYNKAFYGTLSILSFVFAGITVLMEFYYPQQIGIGIFLGFVIVGVATHFESTKQERKHRV